MDKRLNLIISAVIFYILFIVLSVPIALESKESRHQFDVQSFNIGKLNSNTKQDLEVSIPYKVRSKENFTLDIDISNYLNKDNYAIASYANFSTLEVFADDRLIYKKNSYPDHIIPSGGYYAVYFEIPSDLETDTLRLSFTPLLDSLNYTVIENIYIGKQGDLLLSKAISDLGLIMITVILLLNFSIIFIFALKNKGYFEKENYGLLHLAILGLISGLYFCSQSWILKFIFPNLNCFIHIVSFTSLALIPIPMLLFFKYQLDPKYKPLYNYLTIIIIANVLIQNVLTLSRITEYITMLSYSHMLLLASIFVIVYTFLRTDSKKYPAKKKFLVPIIATILVVLVPLINYIIYTAISYNVLSLATAISFLVLEISEFKNTYYVYKQEVKEKEVFKRLATIDSLTGLSNRTHYNYFLEKLINSNKHINAWIIIIDLDGLKRVNDKYGHINGDKYITSFSDLLRAEEKKKDYIKAFRIGGDEFFIFIENTEEIKANEWINKLKSEFSEIKFPSNKFEPSFSAGYYYFDSEIDNIKEIRKYCNIADKKMYNDKNKKIYNKKRSNSA